MSLFETTGRPGAEATYASGVRRIVSGDLPNGIRVEGTEGWIFVSRGNESVTSSNPGAKLKDAQALSASDPKIRTSVIGLWSRRTMAALAREAGMGPLRLLPGTGARAPSNFRRAALVNTGEEGRALPLRGESPWPGR